MFVTPSINEDLAAVATNRARSLFADDIANHKDELAEAFRARRILVVGGAGSIGASAAELILHFSPKALHIVDIGENALAEFIRDLRSRVEIPAACELRLCPLDYGGPAMERLLAGEKPYDLVLNFAALKHVRSEKDVPSLLQMLDTNAVKLRRFLLWLNRYGHVGRRFSVSTDKAANPASLMGASKRLMELVLFSVTEEHIGATSARFANVAFSNGSLLQSFVIRLARRQPLAVPREVRRYFLSLREAGEICMLAAASAPSSHILFPRLDAEADLRPLTNIAVGVLEKAGLRPAFYDEEPAALRAVERELAAGRYPVLLTPPDTSGEKLYEEFVGEDEAAVELGFEAIQAIRSGTPPAQLDDVLDYLSVLLEDARSPTSKADISAKLAEAVSGLHHIDGGKSLDERL